jgi:hypothetical protein
MRGKKSLKRSPGEPNITTIAGWIRVELTCLPHIGDAQYSGSH